MALRMCNRLAPLLSFIRNAAFVWQSGEVAPLGALRVRATHGAFALSGEDKACARRRVADVLTKTALGSFLRFRCLAVPLPPELCAGQKKSHSALHCPIILWRGEKSPRTGGIKTPVFA